ncbi:hypothetical protein F5Y19DRAFT_486765 [Xylariaceae sp. FL1651]|nr:hypothetical protein F5Y19DRAFT_486765 [Xylariaceae sp. FL1651]
MEVQCQVIRSKDARQYRQRSVSVLPRSDSGQYPAASRYAEYPGISAAPRPQPELVLSPNTYERLAAAKRAQDGLIENARAEALVLRERQYEELRTISQFRESAAREEREREEALRQQRRDDLEQMMLEFETRRAIEEEERIAEAARREAIRETMIQIRDEAVRQRQLERDRILAEHMEAEARIEEAQMQARAEAEERERARRERLRECAVCMEENDMGSMVQAPCEHWYCHEDLQTAFQNALDGRQPFRCCLQEIPGLRGLCAAGTVPRTGHSGLSRVRVYDMQNMSECHSRRDLPTGRRRATSSISCNKEWVEAMPQLQ